MATWAAAAPCPFCLFFLDNRRMSDSYWQEPNDALNDWEYPDPDGDDQWCDTVVCPECGADVYEDADQCPVCGHFMIPDNRIWSGKSAWWTALAILGIIAVILALVLGL